MRERFTMKKIQIITTAFIFMMIMLLNGCAELRNNPAHDLESTPSGGTSSDINSTTVDSESPDPKSESIVDSTSDSSSSAGSADSEKIPVEFTEEDLELHKILTNLEQGVQEINNWFTSGAPIGEQGVELTEGLVFRFPKIKQQDSTEIYVSKYYYIPENYSERNYILIPNTYEGFNDCFLEFFTEKFTDNKMKDGVCRGSMTANADGTFDIMFEENVEFPPHFIEIDKKMYRHSGVGGKGLEMWAINPDTAKIVSKTDDTIEFTYLTKYWYDLDENGYPLYLDDISLYEENALTGVLKYERGGWRRDFDKH